MKPHDLKIQIGLLGSPCLLPPSRKGVVFVSVLKVVLQKTCLPAEAQLNTSKLISAFVHAKQIALLSLTKLVVLPLALYAATTVVYPPMALSVLLLSGISTRLGAPFVANFVGSELPLIVGLIIVTSIAVPFVS